MTVVLADCYGAHTPAEIQAAGFNGIIRYLSHTPGKAVTPSEANADREAGLIVGLNFEDAATNAQGGRGQGNRDGAFAAGLAQTCGYPTDCVIPFSVDYEPTPAELATIVEYFVGVAGFGYPVIPYGNNAVLDAVCGAGHAPYGWQTTAWSYGVVSKYARILQDEYGTTYDTDSVLGPISLWGLDQTTEPIVTKTNPALPEESVLYTKELSVTTDANGDGYLTTDLPKGASLVMGFVPFVKRRATAPVGDAYDISSVTVSAGEAPATGTTVVIVGGGPKSSTVHVRATWR